MATDDESPPPGLPTWRGMYALVIGELVLLVVAFAALARAYRP